tara:strand:+ start:14344 stop:15006 length:663 start_codon:yes stop_codon:yes gene_type:complete
MTITLDASDKAASRASLGANDASNLTTGTVATARLGSGTASSSTFLRGDGSWATAGGAFTKISSGSLSNQVLTVTGLTGDTKIILNCTGNFTGSALIALLSSDGGSSFANSNGDYVWARQQIKLTSSSYNGGVSLSGQVTSSRIVQGDVGNYAEFDIMVPQVSTERTGCYLKYATTLNSTTLARSGEVIGIRNTAQVDNAIQISSAGAGLTGNFVVMKIT